MQNTRLQQPSQPTQVRPYQIERGMRLAIQLHNGTRVAGRAAGRIQTDRGLSWYITVRRISGGQLRIDGADIATIHNLDA